MSCEKDTIESMTFTVCPIVWYKENTIVTTIRKAAITRKEAVVVVLKILSD